MVRSNAGTDIIKKGSVAHDTDFENPYGNPSQRPEDGGTFTLS